MIIYGYAKQYKYEKDKTLRVQVRIPNIHGPLKQSDGNGKSVKNYVLDKNLPWYRSLALPMLPEKDDIVALCSINESKQDFIVLGLSSSDNMELSSSDLYIVTYKDNALYHEDDKLTYKDILEQIENTDNFVMMLNDDTYLLPAKTSISDTDAIEFVVTYKDTDNIIHRTISINANDKVQKSDAMILDSDNIYSGSVNNWISDSSTKIPDMKTIKNMYDELSSLSGNYEFGKTHYGTLAVVDSKVRIKEAVGKHTDSSNAEIFNDYKNNKATGNYSHAEGNNSNASGNYSHAENSSTSSGEYSHSEGKNTIASGSYSHAEGAGTKSSGQNSHAEGGRTTASGMYSHAEGFDTYALGDYTHAEGYGTYANNSCTHAEGISSKAYHTGDHAEGHYTTAEGNYGSHSEGSHAYAGNYSSHAEGYYTSSKGRYGSHSEGFHTVASGVYGSHAEGYYTTANNNSAHAEGSNTTASGVNSHAEGGGTTAKSTNSHAEGENTTANGQNSHAEGYCTITDTNGADSHAEGEYTNSSGLAAHSEGYYTTASGDYSHAEGVYTTASGVVSHAEGDYTKAVSMYSHAEGLYTIAGYNGTIVSDTFSINKTSDTINGISYAISSDASGHYITLSGTSTSKTDIEFGTIELYPGYNNIALFSKSTTGKPEDYIIIYVSIPETSFSTFIEFKYTEFTDERMYNYKNRTSNKFIISIPRNTIFDKPYTLYITSKFSLNNSVDSGIVHTSGYYTLGYANDNDAQFVCGTYNVTPYTYSGRSFVIGNGTSDSNRSDAFYVMKNGDMFCGTVLEDGTVSRYGLINGVDITQISGGRSYSLLQDETDGHIISLKSTTGETDTITIPDNNTTYTLSQDSEDGHKITLTNSDGAETTITIPDNDTTYDIATTEESGLMSSSDKTKLDDTYTKEETNDLVSKIPKFSIVVVDSLPTEDISNTTVYLLKGEKTESGNLYTEYIYVNDSWEKLGTQTLDLSEYAKKTDVHDGKLTVKQDGTVIGTFTANQDGDTVVDITGGSGGATYTLTQDDTDGHKITLSSSSGYSATITIPDNDTKYSPATTETDGLMSSVDKSKLDNIEAGAEINVQADWNETDTESDSYIKNKPNITDVNDAKLTIQKNNEEIGTFTANAYTDKIIDITVPTKTSDLTNDSDFATTDDIHDGTLTVKQDGVVIGTFTANQSSDTEINISGGSGGETTYTLTQDAEDGHTITLHSSAGYTSTLTIPDSNTTYTLVQDQADGHKLVFTPSDGKAVEIIIPDKDTTYGPATTTTDGLLSVSDKTKLDTISSNAEQNVQSDWSVTDTESDAYILNKPIIPAKTSDLINDSGFITTDTNTTYTLSQDATDGHKITLTPSEGTPTTITIPDKDTTYSPATTTTDGLLSSTDKSKLDGIQAGAEANVQSDWNETDTSSDAFIKNKPVLPLVYNGKLILQANSETIAEFTANSADDVTANISIPTKVSQLNNDSKYVTNDDVPTKTSQLINDSGFITEDTNTTYTISQDTSDGHKITLTSSTGDSTTLTIPDNDTTYSVATDSSDGLLSASDKSKLDGISSGAEVNVQSDWNTTDETSDSYIKNKPTIPTKTSDLSNDSGFVTTDENVLQTLSIDNTDYSILLAGSTNTATATEGTNKVATITANPSTGSINATTVTADAFNGDLNGTAAKATADSNGNNIITTYATKDEISVIPKFKILVVDELPTKDISTTTIYLLKSTDTEAGDLYTEYIYVDGAWEKLGTQTLSIEAISIPEIDALFDDDTPASESLLGATIISEDIKTMSNIDTTTLSNSMDIISEDIKTIENLDDAPITGDVQIISEDTSILNNIGNNTLANAIFNTENTTDNLGFTSLNNAGVTSQLNTETIGKYSLTDITINNEEEN